jgi:hypothetical protein
VTADGQLDLLALLTEDDQGEILTTPADLHVVYEPVSRLNRNPDAASHLTYRVTCSTCSWASDGHDRENLAVEAAMDHAWPGWRNLPVVAYKPIEGNPGRWLTSIADAYPDGWVAAGGPVRTSRPIGLTRHHWDAGFRFWDIGVPEEVKPR